jgi:hypothetical protein
MLSVLADLSSSVVLPIPSNVSATLVIFPSCVSTPLIFGLAFQHVDDLATGVW